MAKDGTEDPGSKSLGGNSGKAGKWLQEFGEELWEVWEVWEVAPRLWRTGLGSLGSDSKTWPNRSGKYGLGSPLVLWAGWRCSGLSSS